MDRIVNIAAYKFTPLGELRELRAHLAGRCKEWGLKGTILLSPEGINLFVAGAADEIDRLLADLRRLPGLESLEPKVSMTEHQPFRRMLVRLKKEIIAFGVEGIDPARRTSPKITARELKQWLDEGRPVTLLDTRNDYEVKLGTFREALPIGIDHFRQFPEAVRRLPAEMKERPIVMFCTGGIRCEKAGPFMEREGFKSILQLDGGILKYFEECGGAHYDGECFVFDQRVGVDPGLHETESTQCFHCQTPLTKADQEDARYVAGRSCPYCFKTTAEQVADSIAQRQAAIRRVTSPLPGSVSQDNLRPLNVPQECHGTTLLDALPRMVKSLARDEWESLCSQNLVLDARHQPAQANRIVSGGDRFYRSLPAVVEPEVNPQIRILHEDEALVVIDKPAPLPIHPGGRFNRNTLQQILNQAYHPQKLRPAHRLDANTTGVVLLTRTRHFAGLLQPQFTAGRVEKLYLARVQGHPAEDEFRCDAPIREAPGAAGSREVDAGSGLDARTAFRVRRRCADGTTLLEARPLTGRTNQIRVHLWHLGHPICGDPAYLADGRIGDTQTLGVGAAPLCLHALKIAFSHPLRHERVEFTAPAPTWADAE
jgi:UPF0176 protein